MNGNKMIPVEESFAEWRCTRRWNSRPRGGGIGPLRVAV